MQNLFRRFGAAAIAAVALLGLTACSFVGSSSPSTFYVLSADLPAGQKPLYAKGAGNAPVVGVSNVRIAAFLDRPQMTLRLGNNQVTFNEFVRWAEPLGDGTTRVLRANIVELLGSPDSALPWTRSHVRDYNLFVQLEDIHLRDDGKTLEVRIIYRLTHGTTHQVVLANERLYVGETASLFSSDTFYTDLAALVSLQVGELSVDIAQDILRLKQAEAEAAKNAPAATDGAAAGGAAPAATAAAANVPAASAPVAAPAAKANASAAPAAAANQ